MHHKHACTKSKLPYHQNIPSRIYHHAFRTIDTSINTNLTLSEGRQSQGRLRWIHGIGWIHKVEENPLG